MAKLTGVREATEKLTSVRGPGKEVDAFYVQDLLDEAIGMANDLEELIAALRSGDMRTAVDAAVIDFESFEGLTAQFWDKYGQPYTDVDDDEDEEEDRA